MPTIANAFATFDRSIIAILKWLCIVLFAVLTLLLSINILIRFMPLFSMHWFDEIVELVFAALVFYGAAAVWASGGHFSVGDWISARLPGERSRAFYRLVVELLSVSFLAVFFWYSVQLVMRSSELSTVFQIPKSVMYGCMPIASAIMLLYSLRDVATQLHRLITGRPLRQRAEGQTAH